jgi:hypothetical protein
MLVYQTTQNGSHGSNAGGGGDRPAPAELHVPKVFEGLASKGVLFLPRLLNAHCTHQLRMPGVMHRVPGSDMTHPGILSTLYVAHIYENLCVYVSHAPASGRK